ncbi:MAG: rRNA maturation RNase YbeY [Candidatus Sericytochromatia bacterium]
MEIHLNNKFTTSTGQKFPYKVTKKYWLDFTKKVLKLLELEKNTEVSITFVDNEEIKDLNREYRNKDYATDVLSFPFENEFNLPINNILGDIIISLEKAKEQAEEYGHSFNRELGFLIVHGVLHLLGYDHETKEQEEEMFSLQKKILANFEL